MRTQAIAMAILCTGLMLPQSLSSAERAHQLSELSPALKAFLIKELKPWTDDQSEKELPTRVMAAEVHASNGHINIIVHVVGPAFCGATGMCETLVLEPRQSSYVALYDESVRAPIRQLTTSTNGHRDISVNIHEDAFTNYDVRLYFNGRHYVEGEKLNGYVNSKRLKAQSEGMLLIDDKYAGELLFKQGS